MIEFEVCRVDSTEELRSDTSVTPAGMEEPIVHCFGYDLEGEWHHAKLRGFEPYCYVRYEEADVAMELDEVKRVELSSNDGPYESVRGEQLAKVYTYDTDGPNAVDNADGIGQTWESDVLFSHRFIADMDLESGVRVPDTDEEFVHVEDVETTRVHADWRVHVMDIEVDDRNGFPENGREPIICITAYDSFDDEYIVWLWDADEATYPGVSEMHDAPVTIREFETESEMLLNYVSYVSGSRPSVITGWNVDDFDLPYLWDRCEFLNEGDPAVEVPYKSMSPIHEVMDHDYFGLRVRGMAVFDLLEGFKSTQYTDMESYRLEDVAQEVIGVGKETYVGTVGDLWDNDPQTLVEYNLRDVELCVELDRRQSIIGFWREVGRIARCQLEEATIESSVVDKYLLNTLHGEKVMPNQGSQENISGSYEGGAVFDAVNGLYHNVPLLDLASLYPMSMLTLNISPETKVDPESYDGDTFVSPNGIHFRKDQEGITKRVIEGLLEEREAKKEARDEHDPDEEMYDVYDRQQASVKVIMNSLYGVLAWNRFRLYDPDGARATTACGREVLAFTAEVAEEMGHEVLYGDTDSVLLDLPDDWDREKVIEVAFEVADRINERYQEFAEDELNATDHHFDIEFEKLYERFFQSGAKKRYAGRIRWKEGKEVDDIDITGYEYQRSDASRIANETQEKVLRMICEDAKVDEVETYVRKQIHRVLDREVPISEIGIPEGIGKDLDNYESPTHSVRAAKIGNLLLGTTFASGSNPRRYYLDSMDPSFFHELEEAGEFDAQRDPLYAQLRSDNGPTYIGVEQAEQLPAECRIDWETHKNKCLKQTLSAITSALGLDWDELEEESTQSDLAAW